MSAAMIATPLLISPHDEPLYEVIDGQRMKLYRGAYESILASFLMECLSPFVRQHKLGRAMVEVLFDLPLTGRQRRPDVAFVSYERWPRDRRKPRGENAWAVVPDLAVEVVSPTNTYEGILVKVQEYFQSGVRLIWVVLPELAQVHVYSSPKEMRVLDISETLDGGAVVPGFHLPLQVLFETEAD